MRTTSAYPPPGLQNGPVELFAGAVVSLRTALAQHPAALAAFDALSPGQQREQVLWIAAASQEETRNLRVTGVIERLLSGRTLKKEARIQH